MVARRWRAAIAAAGSRNRSGRTLVRLGSATLTLCMAASVSAALLEFDEYLQRADAARQRGDWQSVASQLAQAINHPDIPATGARRSGVHLGYARAVGVFCQYDEAEKYLLLAKEIAQAAGNPTFDAEFERGVMYAARGDFAQAVVILEPLERTAASAAASGPAPQRMVVLQEQLAAALAALNRPEDAARYRERAQALRQRHPEAGRASGDSLTPYGTRCTRR